MIMISALMMLLVVVSSFDRSLTYAENFKEAGRRSLSNDASIFAATSEECIHEVFDIGRVFETEAHTIHVKLDMSEYSAPRQWILNLGQEGTGSNHWIWHGEMVQFGTFNGHQIQQVDINSCTDLTTTFDGENTLTLYCNGHFLGRIENSDLNIQSSVLAVAGNQVYEVPEGNFAGCVHHVEVWDYALTSAQVASLTDACTLDGFWHPESYTYTQEVAHGVVSDFPSHGPGTGTVNEDGSVHWIWHVLDTEHRGTFSEDCATITWEVNSAKWFRSTGCTIEGFWHPDGYTYTQQVTQGVISDFPSHGPGTGNMNEDGSVHWVWHNTGDEHHGIFSDDCGTITWENSAKWFRGCTIDGFWDPEGYTYTQAVIQGQVFDFPSHGRGTGTMNEDGTVHWIWHNTGHEHHGIFSDDCTIVTWENSKRWFRSTVFVKGPKTGCESGYVQPETAEDCRAVAEANNVRYWGGAGHSSDADPQGCIYRIPDNDIYFNTHSTGSTDRNDRKTVCVKDY